MTNTALIEACAEVVEKILLDAEKGHDWFHIQRVRRNALIIQAEEGGNLLAVELAALLHDIDDAKFNGGDESAGARKAEEILRDLNAPAELIAAVSQLILHCSFKGGQKDDKPSLELQILRDADRLDAIGAIGIARTFHYGGFKDQAIYDPSILVRQEMTVDEYRNGKSSTINHFYEKLLLLKDGMYTAKGQALALERHQFMEQFLTQFYKEWSGDEEKDQAQQN